MTVWLDGQLAPTASIWLLREFDVEAIPIRALGLRESTDAEIFQRAGLAGAVIMTKDEDFSSLFKRHGPLHASFCFDASTVRILNCSTSFSLASPMLCDD